MSVSSQDKVFSCRWSWCRSAFSNNAELNHHVIHDHVRRAIPVRRRDISMINRAEEGQGESLKISELMADMYSYSLQESISHKPVEHSQEPSSSLLPSPPASSPVLRSPHYSVHSPGPAPSPSPLSLEHMEKHNPTFASLSSPEPGRPPFSSEIPLSPSFSSLVERPNKRKMTSNLGSIFHNHPNQPHPLQLSQHSSASFASQNSIEAQLTQAQDSDDMEDLLPYHSSNGLSSRTPDVLISPVGLIHEHAELQWELSQHAEEYLMSDPTSQNHSDGHRHLENLPVMSRPPSQLRLDPSAAVPLSPPSPTVTTPLRQNWYQPPLKRKKRSSCNDKDSGSSPLKMEEESDLQTKSKKMFRSETSQITPESDSKGIHAIVDALPQNNLATRPDSPCNLFSKSSQDSSDLSEINSYPLQTQAPYMSQVSSL